MLLLILLSILITLIYLLNKHLLSFWSRRGFKQVDPAFLIGNAGPLLTLKMSIGEYYQEVYNKYKQHRVIGIYFLYRPLLVVNDAKLVQDIMIKDFTSFHDRPMPIDEVNDPLSAHLFNIAGQKWRDLRVKLSPTFTSGKLKAMFPIIKNCGQTLENYLVRNLTNGQDVFEFRDLIARFNTNIISSVAFGIDNDCINDPQHIFRRMGVKIFKSNVKNSLRILIAFLAPNHFHKLKLRMCESEVEEFVYSIVKQTVEYREQNNFSRNDFLQLLIQLKNQGYVSVDKGEEENEAEQDLPANRKKLSIDQLAANVFIFFVAGFETSSSTLSFCLYELAKNPDIQKKVQDEIDKALEAAGSDGLSYDLLGDLKYAECCIDETLRKYPIIPFHFRTATNDYKVADSDLVIPKGSSVVIPVLGFHRDPEIYDNPMEFKPERFLNSSNGGGKIDGVFYTPFGDGPRHCIGMRLGKLTTKIGLALILSRFNLELCNKDMTDKELEFHPKQFVLTPKKLFNIKIVKR